MSINQDNVENALKEASQHVSEHDCEWIKQELHEGTPEEAFVARFKNHALLGITEYSKATGLKRTDVVNLIQQGNLDHFVVDKKVKIPLNMDWFCRHTPQETNKYVRLQDRSSEETH